MTFSKKTTPLHSTHSTELFKIFFSLLTLSTAFLQKASGPGKKPLTAMLSDDMKFMWTELQEKAFMAIRERLATYPSLTIPDWENPFHIETDVSAATGATLYQLGNDGVKYPIAYHSKTLSKPQTKWSATERELFAIIDATRKFKVGDVHVHTDHQPLKNIRRQKDPRGKIGRWLLELDAIDCKIEYLPGSENCGADCLSREVIPNPIHYEKYEDIAEETIYNATQEQVRMDYESPASMKKEHLRDLCISSAVRQLQRGGSIKFGPYWRYRGGMSISPNGLLMKGKRVVVPRQIQQQVIIDYHGQNHSGVVITAAMIKERFWFKAIGKQVKEWIDDCQTCRQVRNENDNKAPLVVKDDED